MWQERRSRAGPGGRLTGPGPAPPPPGAEGGLPAHRHRHGARDAVPARGGEAAGRGRAGRAPIAARARAAQAAPVSASISVCRGCSAGGPPCGTEGSRSAAGGETSVAMKSQSGLARE